MDGCTALTSLVIWVLFCASRVSLSSTTGMTQPFKYSLSYLYSYCQTGGRLAFGTRNISYCTLHPAILEKFQTHVTLLQRVLGGIEKVGPLWGPHPPEFGGFILLLVIQLEQKKTQRIIFFFGKILRWFFNFDFFIFFYPDKIYLKSLIPGPLTLVMFV